MTEHYPFHYSRDLPKRNNASPTLNFGDYDTGYNPYDHVGRLVFRHAMFVHKGTQHGTWPSAHYRK